MNDLFMRLSQLIDKPDPMELYMIAKKHYTLGEVQKQKNTEVKNFINLLEKTKKTLIEIDKKYEETTKEHTNK